MGGSYIKIIKTKNTFMCLIGAFYSIVYLVFRVVCGEVNVL